MDTPSDPGASPRAPFDVLWVIPETIKSLYPLAPFVLVAWALWQAAAGAPQDAWLPILVGGAVLIDPKGGKAAPP